MPAFPPIRALCLLALLVAGCAAPDLPPPPEGRPVNAQWPAFLPLGRILTGDSGDFARGAAEIRAMEGRVAALKRRAQMLKGPVPEVQERLSAQPAARGRRT